MIELIQTIYGWPMAFLAGLESWQAMGVISLIVLAKLVCAGFVAARAGRSPLWVLSLLVPYAGVLCIWLFAYTRWPAMAVRRPDA